MNRVSVKKEFRTALKISVPESELPILVTGKPGFRSGVITSFGDPELICTMVRRVSQRDLDIYLDSGTRPDFVKMYGPAEYPHVEVLGLVIAIAKEIRRARFDDAQTAIKKFVQKAGKDPNHLDPAINPAELVACIFNAEISKSNPIVWQPDGSSQFAFGLYCEDVGTALFLLSLQRVGVGRIGRCEGCGEVMIADRTSKRFHDAKCRVRAFMRKRAEEKRNTKRLKEKGATIK